MFIETHDFYPMKSSRKKQYERSAETSTKILDAAQKLFADLGFEGVSMRAVASRADVNLASIVYYFESKKGLYDAVVKRFAGGLNEARAKLLEQADKDPSLESYIRAYMEPAFRIMTDDSLGGRDYARLLWRMPHEAPELWKDYRRPTHDEITDAYEERIKKFCPKMSERDISWHMHLISSIFLSTLGKCATEENWSMDLWIGDRDYILNRLVRTSCILLKEDQELDLLTAGSGEGTPLNKA